MNDLSDLARACRILALERQNDFTLGHLSMRAVDGKGFWLKRAGIGLEEVMGPNDFVLVSFDGEQLAGEGALHKEWPIHAELLRIRPDVEIVGHTHSPWATRLSATREVLRPVANYGVMFPNGVPRYDDTSELVDTRALGASLASAMGDASAMLIRNHGVVFCGPTVSQATLTAIYLERAAEELLVLAASGLDYEWPDPSELASKGAKSVAPQQLENFWSYLCRRVD